MEDRVIRPIAFFGDERMNIPKVVKGDELFQSECRFEEYTIDSGKGYDRHISIGE